MSPQPPPSRACGAPHHQLSLERPRRGLGVQPLQEGAGARCARAHCPGVPTASATRLLSRAAAQQPNSRPRVTCTTLNLNLNATVRAIVRNRRTGPRPAPAAHLCCPVAAGPRLPLPSVHPSPGSPAQLSGEFLFSWLLTLPAAPSASGESQAVEGGRSKTGRARLCGHLLSYYILA